MKRSLALDPQRPRIDSDKIRCPGCGQTYEAICETGWYRLPPAHYPQPTWVKWHGRRTLVVGTEPGGRGGQQRGRLCWATGNDLVTHLFKAQLAAEQMARAARAS